MATCLLYNASARHRGVNNGVFFFLPSFIHKCLPGLADGESGIHNTGFGCCSLPLLRLTGGELASQPPHTPQQKNSDQYPKLPEPPGLNPHVRRNKSGSFLRLLAHGFPWRKRGGYLILKRDGKWETGCKSRGCFTSV